MSDETLTFLRGGSKTERKGKTLLEEGQEWARFERSKDEFMRR